MNQTNRSAANFAGLMLVPGYLNRSPYFFLATLLGLACLSFDVYLLIVFWSPLNQKHLLYCPLLAFFQVALVWFRLGSYAARIRDTAKDDSSNDDSSSENLNALAVGGLTEISIWTFLLVLMLLIGIWISLASR